MSANSGLPGHIGDLLRIEGNFQQLLPIFVGKPVKSNDMKKKDRLNINHRMVSCNWKKAKNGSMCTHFTKRERERVENQNIGCNRLHIKIAEMIWAFSALRTFDYIPSYTPAESGSRLGTWPAMITSGASCHPHVKRWRHLSEPFGPETSGRSTLFQSPSTLAVPRSCNISPKQHVSWCFSIVRFEYMNQHEKRIA